MTLTEFAWAVYVYCTILGASETSGLRSRRRNREVGGVEHSAHLVGLGRDVVYDVPPTRSEREEWAERLGLVVLFEDGHDHLQPRDWKPG